MNFPQFFEAVDNLVKEWKPDDPQAGATPRAALERIWLEVREQAVYDLAKAQEQRDEALKQLHRHHLNCGRRKTR